MNSIKGVVIFIYCFLLITYCSNDPNQESSVKGNYFGQVSPGDTPELFAPGVITKGFHEHGIAVSPDGNEMFYVTTDNRYSLYIIKTFWLD